jgi:hypothetical protein
MYRMFLYIYSYLLEEDRKVLSHYVIHLIILYNMSLYNLLLFITAMEVELLMLSIMLCSALYFCHKLSVNSMST